MSTTLIKDLRPHEVGDTDSYNRLQMRRAIHSRGDSNAEPLVGGAGEPLRVLVVDDQQALTDTTAKLIGIWGHEVRQAYDGKSALALAATYEPDIVLLDILMPKMNGLEFATQLRQIAGLEKCFLVAISGRTDPDHRTRCEAAGIDLFLIKPVAPAILKILLTWESEYVLRARQYDSKQPLWSMPLWSSAPRPTKSPSSALRFALPDAIAP
jgi:CheY-like chemotaxis protein